MLRNQTQVKILGTERVRMIPYSDLGSMESLERGDDVFARWNYEMKILRTAIRARDIDAFVGSDPVISVDPTCHWEIGNRNGLAGVETRAMCRSHACPMCRCLHRFLPRHGNLAEPFLLRAGPAAGTTVKVVAIEGTPFVKPLHHQSTVGNRVEKEYWGLDPMYNSLLISWELTDLFGIVGSPDTIPEIFTGYVCRNRSYLFSETLMTDFESLPGNESVSRIAFGLLSQLLFFLELVDPYGFLYGFSHGSSSGSSNSEVFGVSSVPFGVTRKGKMISAPMTLQIGNFGTSMLTIPTDSDNKIRIGPKIRNPDRYFDPRSKMCQRNGSVMITPTVLTLCTSSPLPAMGTCLSLCQALNAYQLLIALYSLPRIGEALRLDPRGNQVWSTMWRFNENPDPKSVVNTVISVSIVSDLESIIFPASTLPRRPPSPRSSSPIQLPN